MEYSRMLETKVDRPARQTSDVPTDLAQWPYQIRAAGPGPSQRQQQLLLLREHFPELLPSKPYAADWPEQGLRILPRRLALRRRHIQLNGPASLVWMVHDIDHGEAYHCHR